MVLRHGGHDADGLAGHAQVEPAVAQARGDHGATLGCDEAGRADVPGGEALPLHVGVEAAVGHVGEAEGRAAHGARDAHRAAIARVLPRETRAGQAEVHDRVADARLARVVDALAIQVGALAGHGVEELVAERVEDDTQARLAVDDEGDADGEEGQAVGVVDGPVQRVDDPQPRRLRAGDARFLGQVGVLAGRPPRMVRRMASSLRWSTSVTTSFSDLWTMRSSRS